MSIINKFLLINQKIPETFGKVFRLILMTAILNLNSYGSIKQKLAHREAH